MTIQNWPIALAYRAYKAIVIDWLAHAWLKWFLIPFSETQWGGLPLLRFTMLSVVPFIAALWPLRRVVDCNTKTLTRHHDLFQHVEMEVFVPRASIKVAIEFIREMTSFFQGKRKLSQRNSRIMSRTSTSCIAGITRIITLFIFDGSYLMTL